MLFRKKRKKILFTAKHHGNIQQRFQRNLPAVFKSFDGAQTYPRQLCQPALRELPLLPARTHISGKSKGDFRRSMMLKK